MPSPMPASRPPISTSSCFAAAVPYQTIPSTAPLMQQRLGIADGACAAFDINSTCLSFLSALDLLASHADHRPLSARSGRRLRSRLARLALEQRIRRPRPCSATAPRRLSSPPAMAALASSPRRWKPIPPAMMPAGLGAGGTRYDFHNAPDDFARNSFFEMAGDALLQADAQDLPALPAKAAR